MLTCDEQYLLWGTHSGYVGHSYIRVLEENYL